MLPPKTQEPVIRKIIGVSLPGFAATAALDPQARKIAPPCFARRAVSTIPSPQALFCMALAARSVLGRLPVCRNLHSLKRICCQPHAQPQIRLTDKRIANFSAGACSPPNAAFQHSICENSKRRTVFRVRYFNKKGQDFSLW